MADNRDPRKKSRTRRQLRTSSSDRSKRSKASAKDTPRPTSSTDRAKQQGKGSKKVTSDKTRTRTGSAKVTSGRGVPAPGRSDNGYPPANNIRPGQKGGSKTGDKRRSNMIKALSKNNEQASKIRKAADKVESNLAGKKERDARRGNPKNKIVKGPKGKAVRKKPVGPPSGAHGPKTPPVQGPSRKTPTKIGQRSPNVAPKGPPTTRPKPGKGGGNGLRSTLIAGAATALTTGALRNPVSRAKTKASNEKKAKASTSKGKYNTRDADGTVRSRAKVGPKKVGEGKVGTIAQAFDKSYAAAKKAGKKTFTFKGKKYSTK